MSRMRISVVRTSVEDVDLDEPEARRVAIEMIKRVYSIPSTDCFIEQGTLYDMVEMLGARMCREVRPAKIDDRHALAVIKKLSATL